MNLRLALLALLFLEPSASFGQQPKTTEREASASTVASAKALSGNYNPANDASADIARAILEAHKTGKRILLDVGGDWCPWCLALDQLLRERPDLARLRDDNFITVPVYYNADNKNVQALSRYSKVLGIPHCFVLENTGALLQSQPMVELQTNGSYSPEKLKEFLTKWSPPITGR